MKKKRCKQTDGLADGRTDPLLETGENRDVVLLRNVYRRGRCGVARGHCIMIFGVIEFDVELCNGLMS